MKAKLIVTPFIDPENLSLAEFQTDMLLCGRFQDGGAGPVQAFDDRVNGRISRFLASKQFTGKVGNRFTYRNDGGPQKKLLVIGLGASTDFNCATIARVLGIAIHKAVKHNCTRLSIPFFPNRSNTGLPLTEQAQTTHEAAIVKLAEYEGDGELIIELVCTKKGPAKGQLERGLAKPITGRICCRHVDGNKA